MSGLGWPGRGRRGAHGGGPLGWPGRRAAVTARSTVATGPAPDRDTETLAQGAALAAPPDGAPQEVPAAQQDAAGTAEVPRGAPTPDVPAGSATPDVTGTDDAAEAGSTAADPGRADAGTGDGESGDGETGDAETGDAETGGAGRSDAAGPEAEPADPGDLLPPVERIRAVLRDEPAPSGPPAVEDDLPIGKQAAAAVRALNADGRDDFPRPAARRIITIANQKGGVGKTTTTVNLAAALALHGMEVLVIDLDPQGNASTALGVPHSSGTPSVYEVLIEHAPIADVVQPADGVPRLSCVPATIDLAGAEIELVSVVARESRLQRAIEAYCAGPGSHVDVVLVDCPPSLGLLTVNAMVATQELLIPIQCEYYALEGLGQLLKNVEMVRAHLNPALHVSTILLTMYDARTRLADQVAEEVRSHFGGTVLSTAIPRSVRVSEAPGYGQSVVTYDPGSRGALAYVEAAREIAVRGAQPS